MVIDCGKMVITGRMQCILINIDASDSAYNEERKNGLTEKKKNFKVETREDTV